MRIAICDDLRDERVLLVPMLSEYLGTKDITADFCEFDSGEALLADYSQGFFDIVFLDVYMEGMTGVETAQKLRVIDADCLLIFTTTSREHGADAFDLEAFHYLVKPVEKEKLFSVMDRWYDLLCEIRTISIKEGRTPREVFIRDILYIDVLGRNSTVHTSSVTIHTSATLSAMESMLPSGEFVRTIRYCLASLRHIQAISDDYVLLDSGDKLPLSRLERENIRQELARYRLRTLRRR